MLLVVLVYLGNNIVDYSKKQNILFVVCCRSKAKIPTDAGAAGFFVFCFLLLVWVWVKGVTAHSQAGNFSTSLAIHLRPRKIRLLPGNRRNALRLFFAFEHHCLLLPKFYVWPHPVRYRSIRSDVN
jgi:hypothetical protein